MKIHGNRNLKGNSYEKNAEIGHANVSISKKDLIGNISEPTAKKNKNIASQEVFEDELKIDKKIGASREAKINEFMSTLDTSKRPVEKQINFEDVMKLRKVIGSVKKIDAYKGLSDDRIYNILLFKFNSLNFLRSPNESDQALNKKIETLFEIYPSCFDVLHVLVASRDHEIFTYNVDQNVMQELKTDSLEDVKDIIYKSGLSKLLCSKNIAELDIVSFVFGVETGSATNARKNKGGTDFEKDVANIIYKIGSESINISKQVSLSNFVNESEVKFDKKDIKIFDFVIEMPNKKYLIEVNRYYTDGSKIYETSRAYQAINDQVVKRYPDGECEFIWVTDGRAWQSKLDKLDQAMRKIDKVFTLKQIEKFVDSIVKK